MLFNLKNDSMKLIFKLGIIFSLSTFLIFSSCDKDEIYTIPSNNRPPPPPQTTQNEIILDSLVWNYWHDQNDPSCFDEIYLYIPDTAKILSNTPLRIFVRLDSSITWVPVNELTNGNCTASYYY